MILPRWIPASSIFRFNRLVQLRLIVCRRLLRCHSKHHVKVVFLSFLLSLRDYFTVLLEYVCSNYLTLKPTITSTVLSIFSFTADKNKGAVSSYIKLQSSFICGTSARAPALTRRKWGSIEVESTLQSNVDSIITHYATATCNYYRFFLIINNIMIIINNCEYDTNIFKRNGFTYGFLNRES